MKLLKGAVHVHSNFEEGEFSLEEIGFMLKNQGYNFLCLTEHNRFKSPKEYDLHLKKINILSDTNFLIIPGLEIESKEGLHILLINQIKYIKGIIPLKEIIKLKDKGAIMILAHPKKEQRQYLLNNSFDGVEVWNAKTNGFVPNMSLLYYLDSINNDRLILLGGPDAHQKVNFFKVDTFLNSELKTLSILKSLKKKEYYLKRRNIIFHPREKFNRSIVLKIYLVYIKLYNGFIGLGGKLLGLMGIKPGKKLNSFVEKFK